MAHPRTRLPFLEQSRRLGRRAALIAGVSLGLIGLGTLALKSSHPIPIAGHAFAVPVPDGRIVVEVLNGTGRAGLARRVTRRLRREGIDVVDFGNADTAASATQVLVRRGEPDQGKAVARALGREVAVVMAYDTLRRVDVSVILGDDFTVPDEAHP